MTRDFRDVLGHKAEIAMLEAAVISRSNVLLLGEAGAGLIMLAARVATILPGEGKKPFRAPHHSVSEHSMRFEIAKARGGVLMLDSVLDFRQDALEVIVDRAESLNVMVIGTLGSCGCGTIGPMPGGCICGEADQRGYAEGLAGVVNCGLFQSLIMVQPVDLNGLDDEELDALRGESSETIRKRVEARRCA